MKNRLALLLTILLMTGLWSFGQVAPEAQPKPQPKPQPPTVAPLPPADVVELRLDNDTNDLRTAEYKRAFEAQAVRNAFAPYKQKTEKGSYIGLGTSPIPIALRDQLKLPSGSGLVVERVEPNSPAEAAGMKVSDIVQKLDDQVLINPHQFGVLVRNLKPDVEIKLAIIRETKPQSVAIKPVEKDLAPLDETAAYGAAMPWRETITANNARYGGGGGKFTLTAAKPGQPGTGAGDFFTAIDRTEMVTDNGTTVITTTVGNKGERRANVVDKATGKIIFDGAIDTDEQRQALPKEVQDQLKDLDQMKLKAPLAIRAVPAPRNITFDKVGRAGNVQQNNLPKPKSVSGSDDDYTWEFTTKTDENGKPELELLLLDKNGKILFQGPFSRTRNIKELPAPVAERLGTYPWSMMIDDLKAAGGGAPALNLKFAPAAPGAGAAPGGFPGGAGNFTPDKNNRPAK